jgi:hypothetical protein
MALPDVPLWVTVLAAVGVGTLGASVITFYGNKWLQVRQQTNEVSKQKIDMISKSQSKFVQLGDYYYEFAANLRRTNTDDDWTDDDWDRSFYTLCKVFQLRNCIFEEFGAIQLYNVEAESIINSFDKYVAKRFSPLDINLMQNLVQAYPHYDQFKNNISSHMDLYNTFKKYVSNDLSNIEKRCRWFTQLISYELNHIFNNWYDTEPTLTQLSKDLKDHLYNEHPRYWDRLCSIENGEKIK